MAATKLIKNKEDGIYYGTTALRVADDFVVHLAGSKVYEVDTGKVYVAFDDQWWEVS